jgi:hypothetical protein
MTLSRTSLASIAAVSLLVLGINMSVYHQPLVGIIAFLLYFNAVSFYTSRLFVPELDQLERIHWAKIITAISVLLLTTIVYYVFQHSQAWSWLIAALGMLFFLRREKIPSEYIGSTQEEKKTLWKIVVFVTIDTILFLDLIANRTTDILISPWHALDPWFFILFLVATGLLFSIVYTSRETVTKFLPTALHLFLFYSVAAIIYTHGFGFDGFIHRATEEWIVTHGFISPKTPYYIGQYSLVAWFSTITQVPVFIVDVFLVPILVSLALPLTVAYTAKHTFRIPLRTGVLLMWLIPVMYFITFNLTTPYNLSLFFFVCALFSIAAYMQKKIPLVIPLFFVLASCVTHILLGGPLLVFFISATLLRSFSHKKNVCRATALFMVIILSILPTLLFSLNNLLQGFATPSLAGPVTAVTDFATLLQRPYWYADSSPLLFELLYTWQWIVAPIIICLGILGFVKIKKRPQWVWIFPFGGISFFLAAFFLDSLVVFPNVASTEQTHYPLRLLWSGMIFFAPLAMVSVHAFIARLTNRTSVHGCRRQWLPGVRAVGLPAAVIIMLSLYFSYPQYNPKVFFPGYNVTDADFHTAQYIDAQHENVNYIVLSNQLTAVAALTSYSFAHYYDTPEGQIFYYAIPSGGPLAVLNRRMLYEGQKRVFMEEAMDLTGASTAYFTVPSFWKNASMIVEGARQTADEWTAIDNGAMHIFTYVHSPA